MLARGHLMMNQTGKQVFVRLLSVRCCMQLPMMTDQLKEEALKCLGFGVTLPLWRVLASTLNQRVRSSSLRWPTKSHLTFQSSANRLFAESEFILLEQSVKSGFAHPRSFASFLDRWCCEQVRDHPFLFRCQFFHAVHFRLFPLDFVGKVASPQVAQPPSLV